MKLVNWLQVNLFYLRLEGILVGYYQVLYCACLLLSEIDASEIPALRHESDSFHRVLQSD
jgi:hypothetical protein